MLSRVEVLSLDFLRANQEDYVDQEVTVATFLFTHEEGPWIADNPEKPLWDGMSLKIGDASRIIAKNSSQFRWWFEYQEGYPVMLTGVFRLTDKILPLGEVKKNHPCIEVSEAWQVSIDDPEWKASRSNRDQAAPTSESGLMQSRKSDMWEEGIFPILHYSLMVRVRGIVCHRIRHDP